MFVSDCIIKSVNFLVLLIKIVVSCALYILRIIIAFEFVAGFAVFEARLVI